MECTWCRSCSYCRSVSQHAIFCFPWVPHLCALSTRCQKNQNHWAIWQLKGPHHHIQSTPWQPRTYLVRIIGLDHYWDCASIWLECYLKTRKNIDNIQHPLKMPLASPNTLNIRAQNSTWSKLLVSYKLEDVRALQLVHIYRVTNSAKHFTMFRCKGPPYSQNKKQTMCQALTSIDHLYIYSTICQTICQLYASYNQHQESWSHVAEIFLPGHVCPSQSDRSHPPNHRHPSPRQGCGSRWI